MKFILLIVAVYITVAQGVDWNGNNWALNCDFYGNDHSSARISGAMCGGRCSSTQGCTHWTWTNHDGGTCWMKQGAICKNDAVYKSGGGSCGYTKSTCTDGDNTENPHPVTQDGSALKKFTNCKFTYGIAWTGANKNYGSFDYMYLWLGYGPESCKGDHCTDFNNGEAVRKGKELGKTMAFYTYIIAFEARHQWGLKDCNVGHPSLCEKGATFIRQKRARLIERYENQAKGVADILGKDTFAVYMIEPDFVQYHRDHTQEQGPLSGEEMASLFHDFAMAIKKHHPGASIAWDISPWLPEWEMRQWWGYHSASHSIIDFLFTSGGGGQADSVHIHGNELRWKFMHDLTHKPIIADTGYGVAGKEENNSGPWYNGNNINNRANDGVVAVHFTQGNKPSHERNVC